MNVQQLEYIVALDTFKNFTKAANYCHVTQATLSAMVKKLEEEMDVVLFDRKATPLVTTEIGLRIIEEAKKTLFHLQEIKNLATSGVDVLKGRIRLGIIPTIANSLLPKLLPELLAQFPDLELDIAEMTTTTIIHQLKEGNIDLGILSTPLKDPLIEDEVLYYEALMIYGKEDMSKKYIIPDEIRLNHIWLLEDGHCLSDQFMNLCSLKRNVTLPQKLKFEANSFETLLQMVDHFGGLTMIPELYYQQLPEEKKNKVCQFQSPIPVREISLVYYRPYARIQAIEVLSKFISDLLNPQLIANTYKKSELVITSMH